MTDRFTDNLASSSEPREPQHAWELLRRLQMSEAPHEAQMASVQRWIDGGHAVSPLLGFSLEQRGLPHSPSQRAA